MNKEQQDAAQKVIEALPQLIFETAKMEASMGNIKRLLDGLEHYHKNGEFPSDFYQKQITFIPITNE